ncbi:endonuclease/exonuclease/phosphatase family protein [Candidatus Promineifilum breve]|nr:endonuclease/exonuclease/phosphatase family protein [Candidatus Promineifilum breve]
MTFNIRYGQADDGDNHWERRKSLVIQRIRAADPDLLGLQECRDDEQAAFVKEQLPDYDFFGVPRGGDGPTALEMAPILVRRSAFHPARQGVFWLSETPDVAGSLGWDAMFPRTATWVELVHGPTGGALIFLNTHFDLMPAAIDGAARLLVDWARRQAARRPLIVTGDFNAVKGSAAYGLLVDGHTLVDAARQVGTAGADEGTFHGFGLPVTLPIDWILVSPSFIVRDAAIDRTWQGNLYPSDHYPVIAALDWPVV